MKKRSGFSLIELLVAITIIGIITAISIPTFNSWSNKNDYRQIIDKIVSMINTARINTQSEKECLFSDNITAGTWMIELGLDTAVLGCFSETNDFEPNEDTRYNFDREIIENQVSYFSWNSNTTKPILIDKTPFRFVWQKDANNFETVSIYSQTNMSGNDLAVIPVQSISINYVYEPEESFTKAICLDRVAGYPYVSKNLYDENNPNTLCTQ